MDFGLSDRGSLEHYKSQEYVYGWPLSETKDSVSCFLDRKPLPNLYSPTMPQSSSKIKAISMVSDKKLNSISQLDLSALSRALSKTPTYETYKTLLTYRRTLQLLSANVDLRVEQADDVLSKTSEDLGNMATALANACNSTASPSQTTRPTLLVREALRETMKLQMLYEREDVNERVNCRHEQIQVQMHLQAVIKRVEKVEEALVKKYGVHTVDDEGKPLLNEPNVE